MANGTKLTAGWSDAYEVDFTAGGGNGRPADRAVLRLLAAVHDPQGRAPSRPPAPCSTPASARWSTPACCKGAKNPAGAKAFVDFMLSGPSRRRCPTTCTSSRSTAGSPLPAGLGEVRQGPAAPVHRRPGRDRREPRRVAARVERPHQPVSRPRRSRRCGDRGARRAGRPAAGRPRRVLRAARSPAWSARGFFAGRRVRPGGGARGARPAARAPGAVVHAVVARPSRPSCAVAAGPAGRVRAAPAAVPRAATCCARSCVMPFVMPTVVVGVAFRTLLASSGPAGRAAPRRHARRDRRRDGVLQPRRRGAHRRRAVGGARPRAARRPPRRSAPRRCRCCARSPCRR